MEMKDLKKKKDDELAKLLNEKREALREFRFGMAGSRTRNTKEGRMLRKEIAQILTEQGQRFLAAKGAQKAEAVNA